MAPCAFCQREVVLTEKPGRREECPHCGRDIHCCYQCRFYDAKAHHECREPQADFVAEKDQANFCDYFVFAPQIRVKTEDKEKLKAQLNNLFKKK
ncbi:MAG: hypothetical protein HY466_04385 [Deltaproteobacteria bacterium]|nr:hypothetical protein [Deltaproteobacteria bacterium]